MDVKFVCEKCSEVQKPNAESGAAFEVFDAVHGCGERTKLVPVVKGVWVKNDDPEIRIIIERVYQKKDTVNFFYFMCKLTGGGTITKEELVLNYTRQGD